MKEAFDLQKHIAQGVEKIVADTVKATLKNPTESAFMLRFAAASKKASKKRMKLEEEGLHVPGFLIASITSSCNLHCAGCYSRCNNATVDAAPVEQLSREEWLRVFREAEPQAPDAPRLRIDRKRARQLMEKRLAMGHKPDDHEEQVTGQEMVTPW